MPYKDKEKKRQNMAKWRKAHPDRVRDMHVKQKYGITFEEVEILRGQQGNCCALCDKKFLSTPWFGSARERNCETSYLPDVALHGIPRERATESCVGAARAAR